LEQKKQTDENSDLLETNPHQGEHEDPQGRGNRRPAGNTPKNFNVLHIIIVIFLLNILLNLLFTSLSRGGLQIEYSQFIKLVEGGHVSRVQIGDDTLQITLRDAVSLSEVERVLYPQGRISGSRQQTVLKAADVITAVRIDDPALVELLRAHNVDFFKPMSRNSPIFSFILSWVMPIMLMYLLFSFMSGRIMGSMGQGGGMGGLFGVGKSKAKEYNLEKSTGVKFSDVAGQDEAKESLIELVDFLKFPTKYHKIGARQPKGALLVGPPGTGKTLLAKAIAGEAGVPFYSISGSEFVEMFVGVGASRVRDLFENAKWWPITKSATRW